MNIEQNIISSWLRVYPWVQVTSFETQTHTQTLHILFSFFRQDILVVLVYFAEFLGNEKENIKNKDSQWRIRFSPFVITVSRRASSLWKEDDLWNLPSSSLYSFVDDIITPSDSCRVCWCRWCFLLCLPCLFYWFLRFARATLDKKASTQDDAATTQEE